MDQVERKVSPIATPSKQHLGGALPYALTGQGVLLLANVFRSKTAIAVSIRIIGIFVKMREMLSTQTELNPLEKPRPGVGFRRSDEQD